MKSQAKSALSSSQSARSSRASPAQSHPDNTHALEPTRAWKKSPHKQGQEAHGGAGRWSLCTLHDNQHACILIRRQAPKHHQAAHANGLQSLPTSWLLMGLWLPLRRLRLAGGLLHRSVALKVKASQRQQRARPAFKQELGAHGVPLAASSPSVDHARAVAGKQAL